MVLDPVFVYLPVICLMMLLDFCRCLYRNEKYQLRVDFPEHYPTEAPQTEKKDNKVDVEEEEEEESDKYMLEVHADDDDDDSGEVVNNRISTELFGN